MRITQIRIFPVRSGTSEAGAEAEVVLDGMLALRGIRIRRTRFGPFLTFPAHGARSTMDFIEPAFAKSLRKAVLEAFLGKATHAVRPA